MDLRKSHLRKSPQVGLLKVGLPESYRNSAMSSKMKMNTLTRMNKKMLMNKIVAKKNKTMREMKMNGMKKMTRSWKT